MRPSILAAVALAFVLSACCCGPCGPCAPPPCACPPPPCACPCPPPCASPGLYSHYPEIQVPPEPPAAPTAPTAPTPPTPPTPPAPPSAPVPGTSPTQPGGAGAPISERAPGIEDVTDADVPYNETCPVLLGNKVDPRFKTKYHGKVIGFCCPMCRAKFERHPEKYEKNLP